MGRLKEFREVRHVPELIEAMLPDGPQLEDGVLYVVDHEEQREQFVEYNCPCGCGKVVWIPYYREGAQKEIYPSWALRDQEGRVTLRPSILSSEFACKSHYFIRDNRIEWC